MKKTAFITLILIVLLSVNSFAMPFLDVEKGTKEAYAIEKLWKAGYVNGYNETTFAPDNHLTRAEFVKIVNNVFSYTQPAENPFNDIFEGDWYYGEVLKAVQADYIKGMGDGRFCPNDKVTREQVCVIINNILKMEPVPISVTINDEVSDWAVESVRIVISNGLAELEEGDVFRATVPITRGEVSVILAKCVVDKSDIVAGFDLDSLADDVLIEKMNRIINDLNDKVIPLCYLEPQKKVVEAIADSMGEYLKDRTFDYKKAKDDTFEIYKTMKVREDRIALQNMIIEKLSLDDLTILYEFFFPTEE